MYPDTGHNPLFQQALQDPAVRRLRLNRHASLFHAGNRATELYIVDSGLIAVRRTTNAGRNVTVRIAGTGGLLGVNSVAGEPIHHHDAVTLQPSTVVCMPAEIVLGLCERHAQAWQLLIQHTLASNEQLCAHIEQLCGNDVRTRLLYYLEELARLTKASAEGSLIHISQSELAEIIGATRETTSTVLNQLAREGRVRLGHRFIDVCNQARIGQAQLAAAAGR